MSAPNIRTFTATPVLAAAIITGPGGAGEYAITGLSGCSKDLIGHVMTLSGGSAGNDGDWLITGYVSTTELLIYISSASAVSGDINLSVNYKFSVPGGVTSVLVRAIGGGGGGGGGGSATVIDTASSGGGGAGAMVHEQWFTSATSPAITPGSLIAMTVGAGGGGGTAGSNVGPTGGGQALTGANTIFGGIIVGYGAQGGQGGQTPGGYLYTGGGQAGANGFSAVQTNTEPAWIITPPCAGGYGIAGSVWNSAVNLAQYGGGSGYATANSNTTGGGGCGGAGEWPGTTSGNGGTSGAVPTNGGSGTFGGGGGGGGASVANHAGGAGGTGGNGALQIMWYD